MEFKDRKFEQEATECKINAASKIYFLQRKTPGVNTKEQAISHTNKK